MAGDISDSGLIDDIKSNSKFITEQLRLEIKTLNDKVASQSASITQYENNLIKHVTAMKSLYKIIKDTTPLNTMPIQTVSSSLEDKFDWYEEEIQRAISVILSHKENSNEDHIEISKVHEMIKVYANDILHIIRPYITEEESEIDLKVFDDKENFEESLIVSAIEALKKHIKRICEMVSEAKKKNEKVSKDFSEMIKETKVGKILNGVRGEAPKAVGPLADTMEKIQRIIFAIPEIKSIDINPILIIEKRAVVVDFKMILATKKK